jgi:hypothetical protein
MDLSLVVMMSSSSFSVNPYRLKNTSEGLQKKAALLAMNREETKINRAPTAIDRPRAVIDSSRTKMNRSPRLFDRSPAGID